jgi:hypothetical protein
VTDEDIEKAIGQMAEQQRRASEAVKAEVLKEQKLDLLKNRIRLSKTLDFLLDQASVKVV